MDVGSKKGDESGVPELEGYPRIKAEKKLGDEQFHQGKTNINLRILDFWRWAASDLVSNTMRGVLAEYIVASALGVADGTRIEWDAFDIITPDGIKLEVKTSAYLQSWYHKELSKIRFSIRQALAWDAHLNAFEEGAKRSADIYVFCLLKHKDKSTLDPLDLDQWDFYILPASRLNKAFPTQKSIGLASLLSLEPITASYHEIKGCVDFIAAHELNET